MAGAAAELQQEGSDAVAELTGMLRDGAAAARLRAARLALRAARRVAGRDLAEMLAPMMPAAPAPAAARAPAGPAGAAVRLCLAVASPDVVRDAAAAVLADVAGADRPPPAPRAGRPCRVALGRQEVLLHQRPPPPPPPRTKWTRRVPHPVLIGHAASLTPY